MKYFYIILFSLFIVQPSYAGTVKEKLKYDEISIGYIPSRGASYKGKPHKTFTAKSLVHHKNKEIKDFFITLSDLASEGITDNATRFHEPTLYIEVIFQGKSVRLFYSGDSKLAKYRHYEQRWKLLHKRLHEYLDREISPDHRFNLAP